MMNYRDIRVARDQAEQDIERADQAVREAVKLITGRLKSAGVRWNYLDELKRELKDYNMQTNCWKD
jgi:ABC-type sulfate transport system substrate-binding protein